MDGYRFDLQKDRILMVDPLQCIMVQQKGVNLNPPSQIEYPVLQKNSFFKSNLSLDLFFNLTEKDLFHACLQIDRVVFLNMPFRSPKHLFRSLCTIQKTNPPPSSTLFSKIYNLKHVCT